jgi:hypothetical protein
VLDIRSVGEFIMRLVALITLSLLAGAIVPQSKKQQAVIEYGPAPAYRIIGVHRLVADPTGCQIQRYSGKVVALDAGNPYEATLLDRAILQGFTLTTRAGKIYVAVGGPQFEFFSNAPVTKEGARIGDALRAIVVKGRRLDVRAYRCGNALEADSIEIPIAP